MLIEEGGREILSTLVKNSNTNHHVRQICVSILEILNDKGPFYIPKNSAPLNKV